VKEERDDERTRTLRVLRRPNKLLRAISTRPRYTREESFDRRRHRPRIGFSFFFPLKKRPSLPPFELRINAEALSHLTIFRMHFSVFLHIRCSMKGTEDSPTRRYVSSKASMAQLDKSSAISFGGIRGRAIKMFALIPAGFHVQIHDRGSLVHERGSNYTNDRQ